jgi:polar amino acid transport system substrate-binding protein
MSTKNILPLCICLICTIFTSAAFAQEFPPDLQRIMDKKELIVAMVASDHPPFFTTGKDGKLHGFDVEIAKDIAKELGVEVRLNRTAKTFDGTVEGVKG